MTVMSNQDDLELVPGKYLPSLMSIDEEKKLDTERYLTNLIWEQQEEVESNHLRIQQLEREVLKLNGGQKNEEPKSPHICCKTKSFVDANGRTRFFYIREFIYLEDFQLYILWSWDFTGLAKNEFRES